MFATLYGKDRILPKMHFLFNTMTAEEVSYVANRSLGVLNLQIHVLCLFHVDLVLGKILDNKI